MTGVGRSLVHALWTSGIMLAPLLLSWGSALCERAQWGLDPCSSQEQCSAPHAVSDFTH